MRLSLISTCQVHHVYIQNVFLLFLWIKHKYLILLYKYLMIHLPSTVQGNPALFIYISLFYIPSFWLCILNCQLYIIMKYCMNKPSCSFWWVFLLLTGACMPITPDEKVDKYKLLSYIVLHSLIIAVSALCIVYYFYITHVCQTLITLEILQVDLSWICCKTNFLDSHKMVCCTVSPFLLYRSLQYSI